MKPTQVRKNPRPKDRGCAVYVRLTKLFPKDISTSVPQKWATQNRVLHGRKAQLPVGGQPHRVPAKIITNQQHRVATPVRHAPAKGHHRSILRTLGFRPRYPLPHGTFHAFRALFNGPLPRTPQAQSTLQVR